MDVARRVFYRERPCKATTIAGKTAGNRNPEGDVTQSQTPAAYNAQAVTAMKAGRIAEAVAVLDVALAEHVEDVSLWLNLAAARRAQGDLDASLGAVEGALRIEPRSFLALLMKASLLERRGDLRQAGMGYGIAVGLAPPDGLLDAPTVRALDHARTFYADYTAEFRRRLVDAASDARSPGSSAEGRRMEVFIDHLIGKRRIYHQKPTAFFYPGLPSIEFFPREDFPWLDSIEAATKDVRRELTEVMTDDYRSDGFNAYVSYPDSAPVDQWAELNNSPRWSAFFLYKDGLPAPGNAERCPATMAALANAPQPRVLRRSPAAMFSVLQPRTRIPPHTGVSNTRLVVHLPLIIPPNCGFRVGNESRVWREGVAWVFDDTIDHEAWNMSERTRTILIFDIWSPFLSANERELIAQVTAAADSFNDIEPESDL